MVAAIAFPSNFEFASFNLTCYNIEVLRAQKYLQSLGLFYSSVLYKVSGILFLKKCVTNIVLCAVKHNFINYCGRMIVMANVKCGEKRDETKLALFYRGRGISRNTYLRIGMHKVLVRR